MGFFDRKPKVVKQIHDAAWGALVSQGIDVDMLTKDVRCVEKEGQLEKIGKVTFLRVFKLSEAKKGGVEVIGWETFDAHPELVLFEGYFIGWNQCHLERKKS
ncbi:MAG: hypothetical protein Q7R57_09345 [Dehalococcoidales bacterium]|nr:hypothetical protein [Dehalococcoidales bacterium]